VEYLHL